MKRGRRAWLLGLLLLVSLCAIAPPVQADPRKDEAVGADLAPRLEEILQRRAKWLLTGENPPPLEADYLPGSKTAQWALDHEKGKVKYMRTWAANRNVQFVEVKTAIRPKYLSGDSNRARFYVAQSMQLGYVYPGEETVNRFGVGTRHIIELRRKDEQWLINLEWYTDPLGDDTEVPDVTPAQMPAPLQPQKAVRESPLTRLAAAVRGYDRDGAVRYADEYCGLAWGCGNENRYNPKFRDYNGVGGDCTNYVSQALQQGGRLNIGTYTRVDGLAGHLQYSGRAALVAREPFHALWKRGKQNENLGLTNLVRLGDLIAYQEKGKLEHFAIITGFDSRGYPLINSHTADRYHVPFDLGWDRKTIYWVFKMR